MRSGIRSVRTGGLLLTLALVFFCSPHFVQAATIYNSNAGEQLTSAEGTVNTITTPTCPGGYTLVNYEPVSSYEYWTSVGLCIPTGESNSYQLTSAEGTVNTITTPTCPGGYTLVNYEPVSSYEYWTSVGLCVENNTSNTYSYVLTRSDDSTTYPTNPPTPACPSGYSLVNYEMISSYLYYTDVGLCQKYSPPPPSCSVTLSPDPASYSYSGTPVTLSWSFLNASTMYINNVGYVGTANGSTAVPSTATTDYTCSAGNGSATTTSPATLTVAPPSQPTTTITASSTSVYAGQPVNLTSTFAASPATSTVSVFAQLGNGAEPYALAFDSSGNLYSANYSGTVSKITPAGVVSTLANNFSDPEAIAVDSSGNVYIANWSIGRISKITPAGAVSTFASGLSNPKALVFDASGNLYVANSTGSGVSKITPAGAVSTFASAAEPFALAFDSSGNLYIASYESNNIYKVTPGGTESRIANLGGNYDPGYIALDPSGDVYTPSQTYDEVSEVYPNGNAFAVVSGFDPGNVFSDPADNNLYVVGSGVIYKYTFTPFLTLVSTYTVSAGQGYAFDSAGSLYTANFATGAIYKITNFSGDSLTADNIDGPYGNGLGANTNPGPQYISFSTTTPGTYTFYALAQTSYYPSWTTYASTTVTVTANPSCTVSLAPTSITKGGNSTLSYSSSNATSFSINNVGSLTPDTSGHVVVSPSQSTDYTGTASVGSVSSQCTAAGTSPAGTLAVSCTPTYSCSGQTIEYTNSSCNTSAVTTCVSPQFCSSGSSECQYPPITFNSSATTTGQLQLIPNLVSVNESTTVSWNVSAQSCTVTGTNGDSWSGLSGNETSKPIEGQTTYTLTCSATGDATTTESATVNVAPSYEEI